MAAMTEHTTGQVDADRAARTSEDRYRALTEIAPVGIFHADADADADGQLAGHVGTITDITALKAAQQALQEAHDHQAGRVQERTAQLNQARGVAERSDRVTTAFVATMSHELRTPLNSILGFTDVILEGFSGPLTGEQLRQLTIVRESAAHLQALIEDVLDVTRIEAGQIGLEFTEVDVHGLCARRVAAFEAAALRKGIALELRDPGRPLRIRSDARRAGQIVTNLLANAMKFTDAGRVSVEIRELANHVEIDVADTGIGISAESLARLFKPFTQVARPGRRLHDGTGLGLAISRNLARALGGDITVASTEGRGSCFTLWLPHGDGTPAGASVTEA